MSELQTKINDYRLVKTHLDGRNLRVQMVVGMLALFFLCFVNFWTVIQWAGPDSYFSIATQGLFFWLLAFCLYFSSCLLTALISLEINGQYGNRVGAGNALWAGFLFCVLPGQVYLFGLPITSKVIGFFVLMTVFLWLRTGKEINWLIFFVSLALYFEGKANLEKGLNQFARTWLKSAFLLLFPSDGACAQKNTTLFDPSAFLFIACGIAGLVFLSRIIFGNLNYKALGIVMICLFTTIAFANLSAIGSGLGQNCGIFEQTAMFLAGSFLTITISLICLPAIDKGSISFNRIAGSFGLIALIVCSVAFEKLFTSTISDKSLYSLYFPLKK